MEISATRRRPAPSVLTHTFRKWFRESKIVHDDGSPRVVFHGSYDMDGFEQGSFSYEYKGNGSYGDSDIGFFFGGLKVANAFAGTEPRSGEAMGILPVYLSLQRPRTITAHLFAGLLDAYRTDDWLRYKAGLVADGCDGIIITADQEVAAGYYGAQFLEDNYIAFYPEQIKSAIGNNGQYDPTNSSILS